MRNAIIIFVALSDQRFEPRGLKNVMIKEKSFIKCNQKQGRGVHDISTMPVALPQVSKPADDNAAPELGRQSRRDVEAAEVAMMLRFD